MPEWLKSQRTRRVAVDLALTSFVWFATISQWGSQGYDQFRDVAREPDGVGFLLVLVAVLPVLARRWNPLGVLLLTATASVGLVALKYGVVIYFGPAVALYTLAATRAEVDVRVPIGIAFALAAWAGSSTLQVVQLDADGSALTVGALIWIGAWLLGDRVREGRRRRVERTERTVAEERAHIARELHDSAGHAINVILVQAGAARVLHERDPARSRDALATVETVARETLGEIDRLVGALRDGDGEGTAPLPGIAGIDTLVERHSNGGLIVTAQTRGTRRAVGAAVDRAAYRIAQEALTNAARHGGASAHVALDYRASELCLTVSNPVDPAAPANRGGGRGLVGMRERATLLGGDLEVSRSGGDFRVTATLPYDAPKAG
jgi:signal transduction histidine kinase